MFEYFRTLKLPRTVTKSDKFYEVNRLERKEEKKFYDWSVISCVNFSRFVFSRSKN